MIYQLLGTTIADFTESLTFPCPYDDAECRKRIYECISSLARNANPFAPISLSFALNLADKGELDNPVASTSHKVTSVLERIIHPICPSFNFQTISTALTSDVPEASENEMMALEDSETVEIQTATSFCQTDDTGTDLLNQSFGNTSISSQQIDLGELQDSILFTIQNSLKKFMTPNRAVDYHVETMESSSSPFLSEVYENTVSVLEAPSTPIRNGFGKRKEEVETPQLDEEVSTKKFKGDCGQNGETDEIDVEDMLKDFVDTGPEN